MAVYEIRVTFLHVDQGMGTLIEIYTAKDTLTNLILIDLGSKSTTKALAKKGVETVVKALGRMAKPALDLVLISHQDGDHLNLLEDLTKQIQVVNKAKLGDTKVNELRYGGEGENTKLWGRLAKKRLDKFEKAFKVKGKRLALNECSYLKPPIKNHIAVIADEVYVRLLCSGVVIPGLTPNLQKNCASAVVVIDFAKVNVVLPGDAIADTLAWINWNVYTEWFFYGLSHPETKAPTDPCRALGVPHHGAIRTFGSQYVTEGTETDLHMIEGKNFAKHVNAENIVASAGIVANYKHPYKKVMTLLGEYAKPWPKHNIVWFDPARDDGYVPKRKKKAKVMKASKGSWVAESTVKGMHTTIIQPGDPPDPEEPTFTINAKGEIFFASELAQAKAIRSRDRHPAKPSRSE